jgi:hypothetical protein
MLMQPGSSGPFDKLTLYDFSGKALATGMWGDGAAAFSWGPPSP